MKQSDWVLSFRKAMYRNTKHAVFALSFALALSFVACVSAKAAADHRGKPGRYRTPHLIVSPSQGIAPHGQFAVPGWSDGETRRWLDNASSGWSQA
jgi:hypothetical protein